MSDIECYKGRLFNISNWKSKDSMISYLDSFYNNDTDVEYNKGDLDSFYSDKYIIIYREDMDKYALFSIIKEEEDPCYNCIINETGTLGEYKFLTTYYDGGTYLEEMLQDGFNRLFKKH